MFPFSCSSLVLCMLLLSFSVLSIEPLLRFFSSLVEVSGAESFKTDYFLLHLITLSCWDHQPPHHLSVSKHHLLPHYHHWPVEDDTQIPTHGSWTLSLLWSHLLLFSICSGLSGFVCMRKGSRTVVLNLGWRGEGEGGRGLFCGNCLRPSHITCLHYYYNSKITVTK